MFLEALGITILLLALFLWSFRSKQLPGIPAADGFHWYLGHALEIKTNMDRFFDWNTEVSAQFGFKTWQQSTPGVVKLKIVDAASVEHILKTNMDNYVKTISAHDRAIFHELIGSTGLLMAQGKPWHRIRKTASHLFSQRELSNHMVAVFLRLGHQVTDLLEASHEEGKPVDIQDVFFRYTMDSFCEIAFGAAPNSLLQAEVPAFSVAFDRIQERIFTRRLEPAFVFWLKRLYSKDETQMRQDAKTIDDFLYPIIRRARSASEAEGKTKGDLISLFVARAKADGEALTEVYLRDQAMAILLAGRDTTASVLTSMTQLLSQHPEAEARLRKEIDDELQGELPTHDSVRKLKFMECVFNEALRLFPSAPIDYRKAAADDTLPDGTKVPAGTELVYLPWVMGRNPKHFPDPEVFRPERWEVAGAEAPPRPWSFEWPAFNAGPRSCLGRGMSYLEAKLILSMIMQKYELKMVPGQHLNKWSFGLTLVRHGGQMMTAVPRKL